MPMLTPQIDTVAEMITYLRADAGVTAQVATRVYGPPGIPNGAALQKMIDVFVTSEPNKIDVPMLEAEIQVRCWGTTAKAAWQVYQAVNAALHRTGLQMWVGQNAGTVIMYQCYKSFGPLAGMDDTVTGDEWPNVIARYTAILAENEQGV